MTVGITKLYLASFDNLELIIITESHNLILSSLKSQFEKKSI